jgi:hypothetical protein
MLMDSASLTFPFICLGLYTSLPFQAVGILAGMPFMFMIFFSTTLSPGAGIDGLKELRYLFSRFYLWCMLPQVQDSMEGCPEGDTENLVYMVLAGLVTLFIFLFFMSIISIVNSFQAGKDETKREALRDADGFLELQVELFGEHARELNESRHSKKGSKHGKK